MIRTDVSLCVAMERAIAPCVDTDPRHFPFGVLQETTREQIAALAKTVIGNKKFILVSNREPYEHVRKGAKVVVRKTIGGLVSAIEPIVEAVGGTWVAWGSGNADRITVDSDDHVRLPPAQPTYTLRRVWLSEDEVEQYYAGQVNQTLWPLCHLQVDKVRFLRREWDVYQTVNQRFCDAVIQELGEKNGIVWFQDYHFATAPAMLRDKRPDVFILQFWHIPWPPWEIFRQHPQHIPLIRGLLGCDLIGMQLDLHCQNFLDCVEKELNIPVDRKQGLILLPDRSVRVRAMPISIDARDIDSLARSDEVKILMKKFGRQYAKPKMHIGVGVERIDYTKGILLRLAALDALFTQYPQWRKKLTFLQISPPSRSSVPAYSIFRKLMEGAVRDINRRHGTLGWQPVVYISEPKTQPELIALFRLSTLAVVSSKQDGMNLVAKEFIASRIDEQGVLILSEFAGAAEEMGQSVIINPYDVEGFAHALHTALVMDAGEQRNRMCQMRNQLFNHTVFDWLEDILHRMPVGSDVRSTGPVPLLEHLDDLQKSILAHGKVELFCDYDGVLAPIASRPAEARLDQHMRDLLIRLRNSANVHVSIISGRSLSNVSELVSVERLTYAGNHGLEVSGPRVKKIHPAADQTHGVIRDLYEEMRTAMRDFQGVIVEDKHLGISLHFRLAEKGDIPTITNLFYSLVKKHDRQSLLRIISGKCVLEVQPNVHWNKGKAASWMMDKLFGETQKKRLIIYLGDDITDEDAFREFRHRGVTIFVGSTQERETAAQYSLMDTSAVAAFLEWLTHATE